MKKINYTPAQLKHLSWLNNELAKKEKELFKRCQKIYKAYNKKRMNVVSAKNKSAAWRTQKILNGDVDSFDIEAIIEFKRGYHLQGRVRFDWTECLAYQEYMKDEPGEKICGFGYGKDKYPELKELSNHSILEVDNMMCYSFWRFLNDMPEKVWFRITDIWFEIHIWEQHELDLVNQSYRH